MITEPFESISQLNLEAFSKAVLINFIWTSWEKEVRQVHKIIAIRMAGKNLIIFKVMQLKSKRHPGIIKHLFIIAQALNRYAPHKTICP